MEKENVTCTYYGILFGPKKEGNPAACSNIDEPWTRYRKWDKPVTKGHILYGSAQAFGAVVFTEKAECWFPGVRGGADGQFACNGTELQFGKTKSILEIRGGDDCTTVWMYLMPGNSTLKKVNIIFEYSNIWIFYHNKICIIFVLLYIL